jgi:hypothetical protein
LMQLSNKYLDIVGQVDLVQPWDERYLRQGLEE